MIVYIAMQTLSLAVARRHAPRIVYDICRRPLGTLASIPALEENCPQRGGRLGAPKGRHVEKGAYGCYFCK